METGKTFRCRERMGMIGNFSYIHIIHIYQPPAMPPAFPGLEMCGSTATSTTSVPTPAAPPAPVADMHWQLHRFIAPAPEEESPLPAARPEAPPKAAAAATGATAATTKSSRSSNHSKHSSTRGHPGGLSPRPFGYGVVLVVLLVVVLVLVLWGWVVGMFLGEVKIRPVDILSSSLDFTSKSTLQTSHPSPSRTALDTPAKPADLNTRCIYTSWICEMCIHTYIMYVDSWSSD